MSAFDVLKYPISLPPTLEEIMALPEPVYKEWARDIFASEETSRITIAGTLNRIWHDANFANDTVSLCVDKLRKIIRDIPL